MRQLKAAASAANTMLVCIVASAFAVLIEGCSSSLQLTSKWSEHGVQLDGNLKDWSDSTVFVEKDNIRCGVMNDGSFLYLCLISSKPNFGRQITFRGMTVWFDPNGGESKTLGVRFPIGGMGRGETPVRPEEDETDQRGNRVAEMNSLALSDFEFLGPGKNDRQRASRLEGQGVEMHISSTPQRFVYEMKIPLSSSSAHPYAVESHPGAAIGICVETNTPERTASSEGEGGGQGEGRGEGPRGGRAGGGGMRGGRMPGGGGYGGARSGNANVSFSFWSHVQLADKTH